MRIHGNLKKWNDGRGFGFISSPQYKKEIFVHISAFPKDGIRPKVGELISFEVQTERSGKVSAVGVYRTNSRRRKKYRTNAGSGIRVSLYIAVLLLIYAGYNTFNEHKTSKLEPLPVAGKTVKSIEQRFKCDGRQHCSQMNSRAEAVYFIRNCPNTRMDGDRDGIPCENDSRF